MKKIALSVLLSVVCAVSAFAQMPDMPMREHHGEHGEMMAMGLMDKMDMMGDMAKMCVEHAGELGLSEDQILKMKPGHIEMQKKQVMFVADLKIAQIELAEIMDVKDFDLEKATVAVNRIAEIKRVHNLEMLTAMKEMRTILTEEQFKKIKKMMMTKKMDDKKPAKKPLKMKK